MQRLKGIGVSPGVVAGRAVLLIQRAHVLRYQIAPARLEHELQRLDESRGQSREQLIDIQARLAARAARARVAVRRAAADARRPDARCRAPPTSSASSGSTPSGRCSRCSTSSARCSTSSPIRTCASGKGDVADLVGRLRMNLRKGVATPRDLLRELDESSVLIADELTPSIAAQVDWTKVRGFATDAGSRTYHTAILARSLEVPAVVGLHNASELVQAGQLVVIDGSASEVILDPTPEELARAAHHADDHRPAATVDAERRRPAATADGVRIRLDANIEFPDDLAAARYAGAEGHRAVPIGVPASPAASRTLRDEDRQYQIYRGMLEGMAPGSVTVRTFDVDEEQLASRLSRHPLAGGWEPDEARASRQGLRGLRLSLTRPDLFRIQLRALLRAARHGTLRIMFPFVSSVEQIREARAMIVAAAAGSGAARRARCRGCRSA